MTIAATPARFDAAQQRRRGMLAKVHIAKKTLGLTDDDYVAVLLRVTTHTSAGDCSTAELEAVIAEFEAKGFTAKAARPGSRSARADHPAAKKARALWISLHQLGAVDDPSERALEAFARRQLKCERLQWADQALAYRLIEALKAMAERNGWSQSTEGVAPRSVVFTLKQRLIAAILTRLIDAGVVPLGWTAARIAYELTGIATSSQTTVLWSVEEIDRVAAGLGAALRRFKAAGA